MNMRDTSVEVQDAESHDELASLLGAPVQSSLSASPSEPDTTRRSPAVSIATLLALTDDGATPLVDIGGTAVRARSAVDLHAAHVGKSIVLVYEDADPTRPIVMGLLRDSAGSMNDTTAQVQIDADGERLTVSAKEQLVLRCGKASITLTKAGKVLIDGTYVLNRSSGVNRVKGGSVQLN